MDRRTFLKLGASAAVVATLPIKAAAEPVLAPKGYIYWGDGTFTPLHKATLENAFKNNRHLTAVSFMDIDFAGSKDWEIEVEYSPVSSITLYKDTEHEVTHTYEKPGAKTVRVVGFKDKDEL